MTSLELTLTEAMDLTTDWRQWWSFIRTDLRHMAGVRNWCNV